MASGLRNSQRDRLVHTLNSHQSSGAFHKDVGQELKARLHYATKKDFFAHIFPNITEDVLNSIEKRNTVQETLRELEKLAKDSNTLEKYYYPHIVGLGNDIVSSLRKQHDGSTMHLDWIDCSNDTPSSSEAKDARIRTDVGLVIRSKASRKHLANIGEEMVRCKDEIDNLGKRDSENRTALENEYVSKLSSPKATVADQL
ncbi:hypothetical protein CVT25_001735 [Psilocybe cyanescens]|uniref:Uncharacterized protein n=1 Tax=Psilocybe cyanescens TaxID=93625 RepID=A0A409WPM0_PSICY|nr:hypothetical protein CVT25_001735 [Psilocybe cyanescens]